MIWNIDTPRFTNGGTLSADVMMSDSNNILDNKKGYISGLVSMKGGNDTFWGGTRTDKVDGGDGDDNISGLKGNDNLAGGQGNDRLNGGDGNDKLSGGLGVDVLVGGSGKDTFIFDTAAAPDNVDIVRDFKAKDDTFKLSSAVFTSLAPGKLAASAFHLGKAAGDADDHIIYDRATGSLYYDPDGNGSQAQVQIATLANKAKIAASDFVIL